MKNLEKTAFAYNDALITRPPTMSAAEKIYSRKGDVTVTFHGENKKTARVTQTVGWTLAQPGDDFVVFPNGERMTQVMETREVPADRVKMILAGDTETYAQWGKRHAALLAKQADNLRKAGWGFLTQDLPRGTKKAGLWALETAKATPEVVGRGKAAIGEFWNTHETVRNVGLAVSGVLAASALGYGFHLGQRQEAFLAEIRTQADRMPADPARRAAHKAYLEGLVRDAGYLGDDDKARAYKRIDYKFEEAGGNDGFVTASSHR